MGHEARKPFAILRPVRVPKPRVRPEWIFERAPTAPEVIELVRQLRSAKVVAIDVETKGTRPWLKADRMVGLGIAWRRADGKLEARYFQWDVVPPERRRSIWAALESIPEGTPTIAHNVYFDAGWCAETARRDGLVDARATRGPIRWTHCTYGLYRQLASEGWIGQEWGLKPAQEDCLGWDETNERELDENLLSRGFHKTGPKRGNVSPKQHLLDIDAWIAENPKSRDGKVRPDKSQMWRAPTRILGGYCCLDALATVQLFDLVLLPALERFPEFAQFHTGPWMHVALLLSEQTRFGIRVDRPKFEARIGWLESECAAAEEEIRRSPLGVAITSIEKKRLDAVVTEMLAKEPPRHNAGAIPKEPKQKTKKDGSPTAAWQKWRAIMDEIERDGPPVSTAWQNWKARLDDAPNRYKRWSPASPDQLREALFDFGLIKAYDDSEDPDCFIVEGINGPVPIQKTEAGLWSVGAAFLAQLPKEIGGPLVRFTDSATELEIARSYLDHLHWDEASQTWRLHASWKVPGTKTGRLGGKDPNLSATPKALEFLDPLIPDDGHAWVEEDAAALEPHVLAELSRDEGLLALYGPNANPNHDRYLYTVAKIRHPMFDPVRKHYDPVNPTAEGVAAAKKECKSLRELAKILVLSGDYGAGARKKWMASLLKGVRMPLEEMKEIHEGQVEAAAGVARFRAGLEDEWRRNGGWVLSGLGFPTPVHEDYTRDLVNRVVQRTGHDIHVIKVWILSSLLEAEGIDARGIVWDYHDQDIYQVPTERADDALRCSERATDELNALLGGVVRIKYGPRIVRSMSEAKMGEDWDKREAERLADGGAYGAA